MFVVNSQSSLALLLFLVVKIPSVPVVPGRIVEEGDDCGTRRQNSQSPLPEHEETPHEYARRSELTVDSLEYPNLPIFSPASSKTQSCKQREGRTGTADLPEFCITFRPSVAEKLSAPREAVELLRSVTRPEAEYASTRLAGIIDANPRVPKDVKIEAPVLQS